MRRTTVILCFVIIGQTASAQQYTAVNGSSYIGSLNVHNNPASIVNAPSKWDFTLLGFQTKHSTNIFEIRNYSLLSNPANSEYLISAGTFKRRGRINANLNLLNGRIALNKKSSLAFGVNLRINADIKSSTYNFIDTLGRFEHFFNLNYGAANMHMTMVSSSWAEIYGTYARTVLDNDFGRLNAGVTIKANRGIAGFYSRLRDGNFIRTATGTPNSYQVTSGDFELAYSSNFDKWDRKRSFGANLKEFLNYTESAFSMDAGLEFLIKSQELNIPAREESYYEYDWKFGISLLDLGYSQYHFGRNNFYDVRVRPGVSDVRLDNKFDSTINVFTNFRDSLKTLYIFPGDREGKNRINHPTRMVLNIDRFLGNRFFINGDLSLDLSSLPNQSEWRARDINLLTITPRYETKKKGYYLPVYYNNYNQLWIGGAVRIGPLLFGVHNWANLFSKKKITKGGGYIALVFQARDIMGTRADKRLDCPPAIAR